MSYAVKYVSLLNITASLLATLFYGLGSEGGGGAGATKEAAIIHNIGNAFLEN